MTQDQKPIFCIVPWMHTFLQPDGRRKLCSVSRELDNVARVEPFSSFQSYWNGDFIKSIRRKILNDEIPDICRAFCVDEININKYKDFYDQQRFDFVRELICSSTDSDGTTTINPCSYD